MVNENIQLLVGGQAVSKTNQMPIASQYTCSGFENIAVDSTAGGVGLTALKAAGAKRAVITVETAGMRWTADGATAPTTSIGHLQAAADKITLDSAADIANFKAIRTTGTSASIMVSYYK